MTPPSGHNRRVSTAGRLAPRLLVVAVLALGLVGMHHLVVAACHHGASHSGNVATPAEPGSQAHAAAGSTVIPVQAPQDAPEAPVGLVGAAATCLAVLLMIVGLVLPHLLARVRRWSPVRFSLAVIDLRLSVMRPPDLALLCVSRT